MRLNGYIITIDFEKAFASLNHNYLIDVLIKTGFLEYFIDWVKVFLKDQVSCLINGGITTKYFEL